MAPMRSSLADGTSSSLDGGPASQPGTEMSRTINDPADAGLLAPTSLPMPLQADRDRSEDTLAVPTQPPSGKPAKAAKAWMESDKDELAMPENNMLLVMPSLCLCLFLASLDQTIIATATPYIAGKFGATPAQYSWVGTAYMLANTIMTPMWGRVSDIVGRKAVLFPGIVVFAIGSALCGASQSMNMLIGARAIQGIGGGIILSLTQMIIGDIVPLSKRGAWNGFLEGVWAISSVLGPILGGLLVNAGSIGWRWIFFINLPTSAVALFLLAFTLKLNPRRALTWAQLLATFDFVGLVLLMSGSAMLVVGFANAADNGFGARSTIGLLIAGVVLLVVSMVHFLRTKRNAIIPPRILKTRTTALCMVCSTLHAMAFLSSSFYLPVFFQGVFGASPVMSAVYMLPWSMTISIGTISAGQINARLRIVRPITWLGYATAALGYGLFIKYLAYGQSLVQIMLVQLPAGLGAGWSLAVPLLVIQAAMPLKEMAASTSSWVLTRALGATLGIAVFQAVISSGLAARFPALPGYGRDFGIPTDLEGYRALRGLPDGESGPALVAFSESLRTVYMIWSPMFALALVLALFWRNYSLDRTPGAGGAQTAAPAITSEKGQPPASSDASPDDARLYSPDSTDKSLDAGGDGDGDAGVELDERKTSGLDELGLIARTDGGAVMPGTEGEPARRAGR